MASSRPHSSYTDNASTGDGSATNPFASRAGTPADALSPRQSYLDGGAPLTPPVALYHDYAPPSPGPSLSNMHYPGTPDQRESMYDPYASTPGLGGPNEDPLLGAAPGTPGAEHALPAGAAAAGVGAAALAASRSVSRASGVTPEGAASFGSHAPSSSNAGYGAVPTTESAAVYNEKGMSAEPARRPLTRRPLFWAAIAAAIAIIVVAVAVPVSLLTGKKSSGGKASSGGASGVSASGATTGGNGSTVTMDDGTKFTYTNEFGGYWVYDPSDPWNNSARANSWTKPLSEKWDFANDRIYGVNLGGWFVLEPFITPAFYQKYNGSLDEWTLSTNMKAATGNLDEIQKHYETFITEQDIAEIAGAGLNWIRLPIPYWAIDTWGDEPFLAKTSWPLIVKVLGWCRKYGIRVKLDLHTIPGSQNGYNHSGKLGGINWLNGIMGYANAQRTLDYLRFITEFISQPEYRDVVPIFGIVNEALLGIIGIDSLSRFYLEAHNMIRNITGIGEGFYISVHDGFQGTAPWKDFLPGADRFMMDTHPYLAFGGAAVMTADFVNGTGHGAGAGYPATACNAWASGIKESQEQFGVTIAGEFSNGWNDCGLFLHGVDEGAPTYPGDCNTWKDYSSWGPEIKDGLTNFAMASMDTLQNWFFWTWKIGPDVNGVIQTPLWSYQLGLQNGWMPKDPRTANGTCESYNVLIPRFSGTFAPSQTGAGDGVVAATALAQFGQWPPPTLSGIPETVPYTAIPTYTATGPLTALAMPTITDAKGHTASFTATGWADAADTTGRAVPVADCSYPDPWTGGVTPTAVCTGAAQATLGGVAGAAATPTPTSTAARR